MAGHASQHFAERIIVDHDLPNSTHRNLRDVADGTILVGQFREVLEGRMETELITNIELLSEEWILQFSIENESKGSRSKEETTEIGMTVTSGTEVSNSIHASAGFSGWGFSAEVNGSTESKTFNTVETSSVQKVTDTYDIPPESSIFVYKKRYRFLCRPWFYCPALDAWIEDESGVKIEARSAIEITANEELISPVALAGQGQITNNTASGLVMPTKGYRIRSSDAWWASWFIMMDIIYPWVK